MPDKMPLNALAQYFANEGKHQELASMILKLPRREGDEYCPFCLGRNGQKSIMKPIPPPAKNDDDEDFWKCGVCGTRFAETENKLWGAADDY
ncbi:MAG: hypothetical protein Q8L53_10525 [Aestuariivirga sp.]|nr:hypothetical protein [Aestuariivirga sp.]